VKYEFYSRAELALLLAETGRVAEAEPHLARCREILADGEDWRGLGGRELLAEAVYAAAKGQAAEAEARFERAIACFHNLTLPWDEAEAFETWARECRRFYRGRTRRSFVAEKLDGARGVYQRIGAGQPWFERLDAHERRLLGQQKPGTAPLLPDGLTDRETEVLRLIARGRSSKEIGEELVLSVRTVERHIANIYLKTETHGRVEAAAYAHAHGLTGKSTAG
jgi:DNA-binding CsgD family transcriptional regulator